MSFLKNMFGSNEEKQSVSKVGWRPLTDLGQLNEIIDLSSSINNNIIDSHKIFFISNEYETNLMKKKKIYRTA